VKRALERFFAPQPLIRLEFLRLFLPLAILGFLAARFWHADDWLTAKGFQVPDLGRKDWRQPLYLPPLPVWAAWSTCAVTTAAGLMLAAGLRARIAAGVFFLGLYYLALADRLEAFTVSKLGAVLALALFCAPCGNGLAVGARPGPDKVTWGNVRFFQILVVTLYCASGISKIRGDWLTHPYVLWTHMHDSYQTPVTYGVARLLPVGFWRPLQYLVLAFETGAPLWFALPATRLPALGLGIGIHLFIGLCFGPVKWFALLMIILLLGCFAPAKWLERFDAAAWK
jgi:hypothetical protein